MLARAKAEDVASRNQARGALVLGCDSVFELDGTAYGKPYEVEVAVQRWQQMRGNTGTLHTGHWLVDTTQASKKAAASWLDQIFGVFTGGTLAVDGELRPRPRPSPRRSPSDGPPMNRSVPTRSPERA